MNAPPELGADPKVNGVGGIPQMAAIAQSMVRDGLEAFMRRDVALAKAAIARCDEVDNLNRKIYKDFPRHMTENPEAILKLRRFFSFQNFWKGSLTMRRMWPRWWCSWSSGTRSATWMSRESDSKKKLS